MEKRQVEEGDACYRHEVFLGGIKSCSEDAATTEIVVEEEEQGEVGEPTIAMKSCSLDTTITEVVVVADPWPLLLRRWR